MTTTLEITDEMVKALEPWAGVRQQLADGERGGRFPSASARIFGNTGSWMANVDMALMAIADAIIAQASQAEQPQPEPTQDNTRWVCPEHGPQGHSDEDGCCNTCGRDCDARNHCKGCGESDCECKPEPASAVEVTTPRLPKEEREKYGRLVREAWVDWAVMQPEPKATWLVAWDDLPESDREADRCIADSVVARATAERDRELTAVEAALKDAVATNEELRQQHEADQARIRELEGIVADVDDDASGLSARAEKAEREREEKNELLEVSMAEARELRVERDELRKALKTERATKEGCQAHLLDIAAALEDAGASAEEDEPTSARAIRFMDELRAKLERRGCDVYSEPCPKHGFIHGAEAEELREGIEKLTKIHGDVPVWQLERLLDQVDARDSLAYVEAKKRAELATDQDGGKEQR